MDFEKICMLFTMNEPFYGMLLSSMSRIPDKNIKTIAVSRSNNVFRLIYNPDWINQFSIDTILQLLKHETLHVAFNHFCLWDTVPDCQAETDLRNISEDLEINGYLDRSKVDKAAGGMWPEDFGYNKYEGTREYYNKLKQKAQQAQAKNPQQPCNGGQGGQSQQQSNQNSQNNKNSQSSQSQSNSQSGNTQSGQTQSQDSSSAQGGGSQPQQPSQSQMQDSLPEEITTKGTMFDDHSMWPKDMSESEIEQIQQAVDELLDFAAQEVEKAQGTIPGEMAGKIEKIRKKPKPVTDWKRYFRRYLGNEFSEFIRKSKKRESRRFPDASGNRHRRKSHILIAIDTSGSVSMPEYREFFGQIKTLTPVADFHVVECDTDIAYEYDFVRNVPETLHGGGGTSFQPPVDLFNKDKRKYDALVYFTDGYAPIPKDTPKDTLWVISSQGDQTDRKKYRVNGASVVFIKPENK